MYGVCVRVGVLSLRERRQQGHGCTACSREANGCTACSREANGCTACSREANGCTACSREANGCTACSREANGCTACSRVANGCRLVPCIDSPVRVLIASVLSACVGLAMARALSVAVVGRSCRSRVRAQL